MQFSLSSLFWCIAGAAFFIDHLIHIPKVGEHPSGFRLTWICVFLLAWTIVGHYAFLKKR